MSILDKIRKRGGSGADKRRVFLLGLDGTPHGLMQELFATGVLKNLAEIAAKGSLLRMSTTIPDVSSVAWTTFMTGVNPGRHGIFGFIDLKPGTYNTYFPNSTHVRSPCLWQMLGKEARRSVVVNMPSTYPAQELSGALIAGFVAIDLEKATFPKSLVPWLKQIGYRLDVDAAKARENPEEFFKDLDVSLEKGEQAFQRLMREEAWDFFAAIVTGTDRLHHFFWNANEDQGSPFHGAFLDYYRKVDAMAGRLYQALQGEAVFLAMSDHGFGRLRRDLYVNRWLEEHGYLAFAGDKRESVADLDPQKTRAFCLDPGRIYMNLKRRFPGGIVPPGKECDRLVAELADGLGALAVEGSRDGSGKAIRKICRRDELFNGPFLTSAPDLVLVGEPGTNLRGATSRTQIFDTQGPFTGMHTQDDAFFLSDRPCERTDLANILDVSSTVLTLLGSPAAASIEGRPLIAAS
ncbi:MAG: alkaline phosphatase family protein [bacterium]